jgi:hypothetical protein
MTIREEAIFDVAFLALFFSIVQSFISIFKLVVLASLATTHGLFKL